MNVDSVVYCTVYEEPATRFPVRPSFPGLTQVKRMLVKALPGTADKLVMSEGAVVSPDVPPVRVLIAVVKLLSSLVL